jgi:hypothetical protein
MGTLAQSRPWFKRQEIPDPQIRDAADQFETARQLLDAQPPGAGVLFPLLNTSPVAIELYLKCLSAKKVYVDSADGWSKVSATPERGHGLATLLDKVEADLRDKLDRAFLAEFPALGGISFRAALEQFEGMFETSRYSFEPGHDLSKCPLLLIMECSHFLQQFVARLRTTETIQWMDPELQDARA